MQTQMEELLTPEEAADYLKVPRRKIWRWCRLPAVKIGKWRVLRSANCTLVEMIETEVEQETS